ncbi:fasciclin domain-containing protein [Scytonema sp. UIC 10036]|uniref:fasciclin domain-containing protein n=1 Tax=Scytonema sp. UIC 10036 TaxID=2304196 RepID=UPI0012DAE528|nr:fasciclin domain-containing protein [Scytonema sp. UIC 10036]MUG93987.1 fasciclin domain-containing protein [Scytonema sp. UIC 10036]
MKTGYLNQYARKLAAIAGIISVTTFFGVPAIAQGQTTTPNNSTSQPGATPPSSVPSDDPVPPASGTKYPGSPTGASGAASGNLVELASTNQSFSTLAQAVEAAGLANTLASGKYTVFAPTDEAFNNSLPQGAVEFLLKPENRTLLRQVLTYHVVPGEVTSNKLSTGSVNTLGGGVAVRVTPERVVVNDGSVIQPDIRAKNGVIHAVNRVLLPEQLRQTIASRLETQQQSQAPQ